MAKKRKKWMTAVLIFFMVLALVRGLWSSPLKEFFVFHEPTEAQAEAGPSVPILVELFTSQGCSSCPPAQDYLRELAVRPDVVAIEFHVDYWDDLSTWHKAWKDVFSSRAATERQLSYNQKLFGSDRVYTPQMVVDGKFEGIGSRRYTIEQLLRKARAERTASVSVSAAVDKAGKLLVNLEGDAVKPAHVMFVRLLKSAAIEISAGENKGERMESRNVAREWKPAGEWQGGRKIVTADVGPLDSSQTCAVFIQEKESFHILAATMCR